MTATLPATKSSRISTVEFWRFFFTVFVCIYHLEIYFMGNKVLSAGTGAVEFFFILAGFTMAMSASRRAERAVRPPTTRESAALALDYVVKKLKSIYPVLAVALLFGFVLYPLLGVKSGMAAYGMGPEVSIWETLTNSEWEWLLLVGTPFGFNGGNAPIVPMWFLTPLLVIGYIYTYALDKHYDFMMFLAPVLGILGYTFFTLNSSLLLDFDIPMGFLNAGSVHAIAEMSLGVSMYSLCAYLKKKNFTWIGRVALTLVNLFAIYRIFRLTIFQVPTMDTFRKLPYLMLIILLAFLNEDYISRVLNRKFWVKLGHLSLAMYLSHIHLVQVYMQGMTLLKRKLSTWSIRSDAFKPIYNFLKDAGGGFQPMRWKDVVLYMVLVTLVSMLILLVVKLAGLGYRALKARMAKPSVAVDE